MLHRIRTHYQRGLWIYRRQGFRVFMEKASRLGRAYVIAFFRRILGYRSSIPAPSPISMTYAEWIMENEPSEAQLLEQRENAKDLSHRPRISIVLPIFNTPIPFLTELVKSVTAQTYDNWELCISNGSPDNTILIDELERYAKTDNRIRVLHLDKNHGISGNTNKALEMAKGEFTALLDHDDTLAPFALFEIVALLQESPELDMIYSDHDYLSTDGKKRLWPLFKPDWSPEIMYSANYITHLTVIRTSLIRQVGGFDQSTDGAQDWDLFFRVVNNTDRIAHISKILYHWRETTQSTANNSHAKPYAASAQLDVISNQLKRKGLTQVESFFDPKGGIHVSWSFPKDKVSIIIPTRGVNKLLKNCISSILDKTAYPDFEILIINNGSKKPHEFPYFEELSTNDRIKILHYEGEFNFSRVNNYAASQARGKFIILLNNDIEILNKDWLDEMVQWASVPEIGAVGAKLLRPNGLIQHAGIIVGMGGFAGHIYADQMDNTSGIFGSTNWYRNFSALTAACLMVRKEVYEEIGGLSEEFLLNGNDVEFGLRLNRVGYRVLYNPFAVLKHVESATHQGKIPIQDFKTSYVHYKNVLDTGDPFFSPNLSCWSTEPVFHSVQEKSASQFMDEYLSAISSHVEKPAESDYSKEAINIARWFDLGYSEIEKSRKVHLDHPGLLEINSASWFIPSFANPYYGGIFTILRFANYLKTKHGISQQFLLTSSVEEDVTKRLISSAFPLLSESPVVAVLPDDDWKRVQSTDITFSTLWTTAYYSIRFNKTKRKFYFIQDYEPMFYPAGSIFGQAEATYHFGFYGLINTPGLHEVYRSQYDSPAEFFTPSVDTSIFFPAISRENYFSKNHFTVFFYGRPGHPRNAFELGSEALKKLKHKLGDRLSIVSAGAEWDPADFGLEKVVVNLGVLSLQQTAALYRACDVGLGMMFTKHPSYLPFEFMASGCMVVSNKNSATKWFLQDGYNCMLTDATPTCISETLGRALLDTETRNKIISNAHRMILDHYSDWDLQMEKLYNFIINPQSN